MKQILSQGFSSENKLPTIIKVYRFIDDDESLQIAIIIIGQGQFWW